MLSYTELKGKAKVLLSFTGLTQDEFCILLVGFSVVWFRRLAAILGVKVSIFYLTNSEFTLIF